MHFARQHHCHCPPGWSLAGQQGCTYLWYQWTYFRSCQSRYGGLPVPLVAPDFLQKLQSISSVWSAFRSASNSTAMAALPLPILTRNSTRSTGSRGRVGALCCYPGWSRLEWGGRGQRGARCTRVRGTRRMVGGSDCVGGCVRAQGGRRGGTNS